jgi:3-phenylpropionate/trans-cinnamate dioxygenase ferredoxin reductase subunit
MGATVTGWDGRELRLDDASIFCDAVVEVVGMAPNTDWLGVSGLRIDDGVRCDSRGRARTAKIYAPGDAANWSGRQSERWTGAAEQAEAVSATILGLAVREPELANWWSDQHDQNLEDLRSLPRHDSVSLVHMGPYPRLLALFSQNERLTGGLAISRPGRLHRPRQDIELCASLDEVMARMTV